jgi:hypothetical protein
MTVEQRVLDFDQVADAIILLAVDGREVEVPRRDLIVCEGPRARGRYVLPESVLEPAPRGPGTPGNQPPYRGWTVCGCPCRGCCQTPARHCGGSRCGR